MKPTLTMKFSNSRYAALFLFLFLWSSCGSKGPDLSHGMKLTIVTNNKEAITDAAGNPYDSLFMQTLDKAFAQPGTTADNVSHFIQYYKEQKPRKPLSDFFYSGNPKGFTSETELKNFLETTIAIKRKRMDEVLQARLKAFFSLEKEQVRIEHPTDNQLIVYIPGITDKAALKPIFGNRSGLHFWELYDLETLNIYLIRLNKVLKEEAIKQLSEEKEITGAESLQEVVDRNKRQEVNSFPLYSILQPALGMNGRPYGVAMIGMSKIKDTAAVNSLLGAPVAKELFPVNIKWVWGTTPGKDLAGKVLALYAVKIPSDGKSLISDEDIASARADRSNGRPEISIEMTSMGKMKWSNMTRKNVGKGIAMELNHFIYSAPMVNEEIKGGRSSITGDFTDKEMDELVKVLNSGSFPLSFKVTHTEAYQK